MFDSKVPMNFSIYQLTQQKMPQKTMLNHRLTMSRVSHAIEDATRLDRVNNILLVGFQNMSNFAPQSQRYRELASHARHIYIFGLPDDVPIPIPNVTFVYLDPSAQLTREWFVISHGPIFSSVLAAYETTQAGTPDSKRAFEGFWSFDRRLVGGLFNSLARYVDETATVGMANTSTRPPVVKLTTRFQSILNNAVMDDAVRQEMVEHLNQTLYPTLQNLH